MEPKIDESLHLISLVVKKDGDVPKVRAKAKLLASQLGFARLDVVRVALAASEMARFLLLYTSGGIIAFSLIKMKREARGTGMELFFEGHNKSLSREQQARVQRHLVNIKHIHPLPGLKRVLDYLEVPRFHPGHPLRIRGLKWGLPLSWEELRAREEAIRKELFADLEESYLETLRAKHEEVLMLLNERSEKNRELHRANRELLQLSRDLEALAHERTMAELALRVADRIRNPAISIGGLARLLAKELPRELPAREKAGAILKEAKKLERIVKDFEELARTQTRFFAWEDLRDVVKEGIRPWIQTASMKGLRPDLQLTDKELMVYINSRTFKVALLHTLKNAEDASPPSGTIKIEVGCKDGCPYVAVSDQGPGIPEEIQDHIFKRSITTKSKGAGVGLMMVQQIMEEHQGGIDIQTSGEGTTVTLRFPERWKEAQDSREDEAGAHSRAHSA